MYANEDHPGHKVLREVFPHVVGRHFIVTALCSQAEDGALLPAQVIELSAELLGAEVTPSKAIQIANWINSI